MRALLGLEKERVMIEAYRCLVCYDPPCSKACPNKCVPGDFIRSLYFDNERGAIELQKISLLCVKNCSEKYCEKACVRGKLDRPVAIKAIHQYLTAKAEKEGVENE